MIKGKIVLITGGTGSFGKKFIEIALAKYSPKIIRIFSRDELKQEEVRKQFKSDKLRFLIGNVRDRNRLYRAMESVDVVIHAAALKQVPACEYNPSEAVKTNINGAINVIDSAIDNKVKKVIALSSDKCSYPVNLYGATKLVAEKLFVQANSYTGKKNIKMSCVRYGNVIGSRGSVIPIFKKQKQTDTITITDKKMTRFWITQEEAVEFIVFCINKMQGGEIFIPKIPSMKLIDLANAIAPRTKKEIIGIRPGEKLNETLLTKEEARRSREFQNYFIIQPEHLFWREKKSIGGSCLPKNFVYASDTNDKWLSEKDLQKICGK